MGGKGGGGGKKKKETPPPQAQQIDYSKLMGQSNTAAGESYASQLQAQVNSYPKLEQLQLGTIDKLNAKLADNDYTRRATDQLKAAEGQASQLGRIGDYIEKDLQGTDIEQALQKQAMSDLQLGRSLSPEQERAATQAARAGMSARGLGTGTGALAAEVLNRDAYATQREAERRNFAGSTNQMLVGNLQNRIGLVANTRLNEANLRSSLAGANITIDPYSRAMNPALGMGASTLGQSGQMIGNTWQNAGQLAGNVASFNANMLDTRYNTYMNNQAAMRGAAMQAGATAGAANSSMMGSGMAAGGMVLGMTALAI